MAKFWAVLKREYLERVRTKWFIIVTLFGPFFFGAIMVLPGYLSVRNIREARVTNMRIVDATGLGLGARVAQRLAASQVAASTPGEMARVDTVTQDAVAATEQEMIALVQAREENGVLVLDSGVVNSGRARYFGRDAGSVGQIEAIEAAVRNAVLSSRLEGAGLNVDQVESITRLRIRIASEKVTDEGLSGSGLASTFFGFGVAFLLYMSIILYGQNILRGVLEEKTTRVAEVIVSSVKPDTLLAGKVLGVGAVGLTQMLVWTASGIVFWEQRARIFSMMGVQNFPQISFPNIDTLVLIALLLYFVLGYTFYASLFAAVGAMVSSQEEAQQAAQPVMMLLIFSIIFVQPVMTNPTGSMATWLSFIPFSAPIIMPMRMTATPVSAAEIGLSLLGVAAACVAAIWLSARIYRVGLLMYGKRPSMRELLRWVRQS
ncbi:MAG: ABC transporter permease [Gemmatimonadaceae bacterium]|nr:ABC transporter permease [Gemmatimonadaceae bacterium]